MCFTVNVNIVKDEMEKRFNASLNDPDSYRPSYYYHAFELPRMPVISSHESELIQLFHWGLIPSWTQTYDKADKIRYQTFNARAETITQKPSFSKPVKTQRCLVVAGGFYEWQHTKNKKIPFYIFLPDKRIISFAGIYDTWLNRVTGELINSFSIITTRANPMLEHIHNSKKRMPVILNEDQEEMWLNPDIPVNEILKLLQPFPEKLMAAHSISPLISKKGVDKNLPELIQPYRYDKPGLFGE